MYKVEQVSYMSRALEIATLGPWPNQNPRVGCVIVSEAGEIVGEGYHQGRGTAHAEVMAITAAGDKTHGATAYVTLEPCNHYGTTGPCTQALIEAGITKVIYAAPDLHARAAGGGAALKAAGVATECGLLAEAANELNREWLLATLRRRPYLVAKFGSTLDGRSAAADGTSQWITCETSRVDVHKERAKCDTIMAGTGTVLFDNPQLTVRGIPGAKNPTRVVVGNRPIPRDYQIYSDEAETLFFPGLELEEVLTQLYEQGYRRTYLEGGSGLMSAALRQRLVDELHIYFAPKMLGAGLPTVADLGITNIKDALEFELIDAVVFDRDVRVRLRPKDYESSVLGG